MRNLTSAFQHIINETYKKTNVRVSQCYHFAFVNAFALTVRNSFYIIKLLPIA